MTSLIVSLSDKIRKPADMYRRHREALLASCERSERWQKRRSRDAGSVGIFVGPYIVIGVRQRHELIIDLGSGEMSWRGRPHFKDGRREN